MAFVHKSARRFSQKPPTRSKVGPGTYLGHSDYIINNSSVPFNSSLYRKEQKPELIPGPGTYNVSNEYQKEKLIASNLNMDIKIVEVPKPNCVFKSGSQRFEDSNLKWNNETRPGPGDYNPDENINKISYKYIKQQNQERVLFEELKKQSKIGKVPSIPTSQHVLGYSETEDKALELNKNMFVKHTGLGNDKVGPGEYNIKEDVSKHKGTNWHKSKSVKLQSFQSSLLANTGPGSYDPLIGIKAAYHYKQSSNFLSKSHRLFDIRKGAIANQNLLEKLEEQTKYSQHSTNASKNFQSSIEDEIEYIQDSTPGPGYYYNEKLNTSFNSHKIIKRFKQSSSNNRFEDFKKSNPDVGPGKYEVIKSILPTQTNKQKNQAPFLISDLRFRNQRLNEGPGPGSYEHPKTLENDLIKKAKFGHPGNFATNEKRFISEELTNEIPGPGEYIALQHYGHKNDLTNSFKSGTIRQLFKSNNVGPDMNAYDVNNFNIAVTSQKGVETDPELAKKIPQFNSSEPRFAELKKMEREEAKKEINNDSIILKEKTLENLLKPKTNRLPPFNIGAERFDYSIKEELPGPGTYNDVVKIDWSKRSYNVAFAEI